MKAFEQTQHTYLALSGSRDSLWLTSNFERLRFGSISADIERSFPEP